MAQQISYQNLLEELHARLELITPTEPISLIQAAIAEAIANPIPHKTQLCAPICGNCWIDRLFPEVDFHTWLLHPTQDPPTMPSLFGCLIARIRFSQPHFDPTEMYCPLTLALAAVAAARNQIHKIPPRKTLTVYKKPHNRRWRNIMAIFGTSERIHILTHEEPATIADINFPHEMQADDPAKKAYQYLLK